MRILFIADNAPALYSGSAVRNYYLLKALAEQHSVDLICLTDNKKDVPEYLYNKIPNLNYYILERVYKNTIQKIVCIMQGNLPYIKQRKELSFPKEVVQKLHTYNIIHAAELNSYFLVQKYIKKCKARIVLDAHNVEAKNTASELKKMAFPKNLLAQLFRLALTNIEIHCVKKVDFLLVCSTVDKNYFSQYISGKKIAVIPNGVDIRYFDSYKIKKIDKNNNFSVLFMGLLAYAPNKEALTYYLQHIHRSLKKIIPDYKLIIIGKGTHHLVERECLRDKSIVLSGFVEDPREYIDTADICIAPLLSGSGTRLKILEYMAMAKAVVSTPKGAEGLDAADKKNIMLAKNRQEFIDAIILLYKDRHLRNKLGENAHSFVKEHYDWVHIGKKLHAVYKTEVNI